MFRKIFGGLKAAGKGILWGLRRPETRIALSVLPGPALVSEIVNVVIAVDSIEVWCSSNQPTTLSC
jgi:hypothetical protein